MKLQPGIRLRSQVDTTEIIVVRSGDGEKLVACGRRTPVGERNGAPSWVHPHATILELL